MVLFGSASVLVLDVSGSRFHREGATLDKTSRNVENENEGPKYTSALVSLCLCISHFLFSMWK